MAEFKDKPKKATNNKNEKISEGMESYWKTPAGMKRRARLSKRMSNPKKRKSGGKK
jgi:hypothetical protein